MLEVIRRGNPWWLDPSAQLPPPALESYRRQALPAIRSRLLVDGAKGLLLTGLRRVGKTEISRQIFEDLLRDDVWPNSQLAYLKADDGLTRSEVTVADLLEAWSPYRNPRQPAIAVIDEVHHLGEGQGSDGKPWHRQIKGLIDGGNIRLLATGSSASVLRDGAAEAPGRWGLMHLEPLSFLEFRELRAAGRGEPTRTAAALDLDEYLMRGGFPETVFMQGHELAHEAHRVRMRQVLDLEVDGVRNTDKLEALYRILIEQSGDAIDAQNLNRSLGTTRPTLESWVEEFERAFLVQRLRARATTTLHERRKPAKIYGPDPGIVAAYSRSSDPTRDAELLGRLREVAVLRHLRELASAARLELHVLHRPKGAGTAGETDFVLTGGRDAFLIEVASRSDLKGKRVAQIRNADDLQSGGRYDDVRALIVHAGATSRTGPVPSFALDDFLERISYRDGVDPYSQLRELFAQTKR